MKKPMSSTGSSKQLWRRPTLTIAEDMLTELSWTLLGRPSVIQPARTQSAKSEKHRWYPLLGADLTETHPVAKNEAISGTARHKARLIVVDSVKTKLTDRSGMFLPVPPGSEHLVANAMLKWIIDQGLFDKTALDLRAEGFDETAASLSEYTPENVGHLLNLDPALIREAAKEYAEASTAVIVMTSGYEPMRRGCRHGPGCGQPRGRNGSHRKRGLRHLRAG